MIRLFTYIKNKLFPVKEHKHNYVLANFDTITAIDNEKFLNSKTESVYGETCVKRIYAHFIFTQLEISKNLEYGDVISFDIHGVLDNNQLFPTLTQILTELGFEIHIITGPHVTDSMYKKLEKLNVVYEHLFSIADYHKQIKTKMWYVDGKPYMDNDKWNKTKAVQCLKVRSRLHFDDTFYYSEHFETPFVWYDKINKTLNTII